MVKNGHFVSPSKGKLTFEQMLSEITQFVAEDTGNFYRLVIGTDSQIKHVGSTSHTYFVTAIVIHRSGRGARYFWKEKKITKVPVLRDKIYRETMLSLETTEELVPKLRRAISSAKYDLEIHIDVGSRGPTREMIKEVVGMVNGYGYIAKTKPESWGASSVADKHT